jgi:large repetitive protein
MRSVRRWVVLPVLGLVTAGAAAVSMPAVSVAAATAHRPPVVSVNSGVLIYAVDSAPVRVSPGLVVKSADATTLSSATVRISSGLSATDRLRFTGQPGIKGSYQASTGVLTLSGKASLAGYRAALRSVTYGDTKSSVAVSRRTVSFQVNDGAKKGNLSKVVSRSITVSEQPPTAVNDTAATGKNTPVDIDVLANDKNPAGGRLRVASVNTAGTKGKVTINPDGTVRYDPDGQFTRLTRGQTATDRFRYTDTNGMPVTNTRPNSATVTVTVTGSDDRPVVAGVGQTPLTYQAFAPAVSVSSALTISDDDDGTISGATAAITAGLRQADDRLSFSGQRGITGAYSAKTGVLTLAGHATLADYQTALRAVTFASADGAASPAARTVSFTVTDSVGATSAAASRTVRVTEAAPPAARDDTATTGKSTAIDINALGNDTDPARLPLHVASVDTAGTKGRVAINGNGTIHYDPNGRFAGLTAGRSATDTFTYRASDGTQTSNPATVTVTVTGSDDTPVIENVETTPLSYHAQTPAIAITSTLTVSDDDDSEMSGATAAITSGYDSTADTLSYTSQNGIITGSFDASTGILRLAGLASLADYQTALQSVEFATGDSSLSPAERVVTFTVTDSLGVTSAPLSRAVDVAAAYASPSVVSHTYNAVGNTPLGVGTAPPGPAATVSGSVLDGDGDADPSATLSASLAESPSHGSVTVNTDGTFTYTPNASYSGSDGFTVTVSGSETPSRTATESVTVNVGTLVWYVDNNAAAGGTGQAGSPFSTLPAAVAAAAPYSVIFVYQGSGPYSGGVTMKPGEDLYGQPQGLTVGGYSLVGAGGSAPELTNSSGDGIDLAEGADVEGVTVENPSANGIAADNVNDATVGTSSAVTVSGAEGTGISISGGDGTLNFGRTSVTGSGDGAVAVTSRTGGTVSFGGTISDASAGIALVGNAGATIALSGTLSLSTGTSPAFFADGGGTVTATGAGSTATTTTGIAVSVQDITIGTAGLTFQSISADGAPAGIVLDGTGSSGGLTVTGTGAAGSGGTIQDSTGTGIGLTSTTAPRLTDMVIDDNQNDGIRGLQVGGLALADCTVSGNGGDGLDFDGLTGTVSITNSRFSDLAAGNAVISDSSGSLGLTVDDTEFDGSGADGSGLSVDADGSTSATVSVTGSHFDSDDYNAFQFISGAAATGTNSVTFSDNVVGYAGSSFLVGPAAVNISPDGNSQTTITVDGNIFSWTSVSFTSTPASDVIKIDEDGTTGTLTGTVIWNRTVFTGGEPAGTGDDISITAEGTVTETLQVTGNDLTQLDGSDLSLAADVDAVDQDGSATMNLTVTGNDLFGGYVRYAIPGGYAAREEPNIVVQAGGGESESPDAGTVCAVIASNTLGGDTIALDQWDSTTFKLPGYTGPGNGSTPGDFVADNNFGLNEAVNVDVSQTLPVSGGGFTGGTC